MRGQKNQIFPALVCSSETKIDQENLQCFIWDVSNKEWTVFETPRDNGVYGFISAVQIPGKQVACTNTSGLLY